MGKHRMTFTDRFPLVWKAFEQSGRSGLYLDRDVPVFYPEEHAITERLKKGEKLSPYELEKLRAFKKKFDELLETPLVKSGKVKLFSNNKLTLDGNLWWYFFIINKTVNRSPILYTISPEVAELVNNARLDKEVEQEEITRENTQEIEGIYDCPDGCLTGPIKAVFIAEVEKSVLEAYGNKFSSELFQHKNPEELRLILRDKHCFNEYSEIFNKGNELGEYSYGHVSMSSLATSFVFKLKIISKIENGPLFVNMTEVEEPVVNPRKGQGNTRKTGILHCTIKLSEDYKKRLAASSRNSNPLNKDDKTLLPTSVSGFVRNQHYGEGNKLVKRIWVDGFIRNAWISDKPKIVKYK